MQHQQLNEEDKFEHYRKQLHALRTHKIKQQRRLQLLQEEGRKLRTLPSVIERLIHFFLHGLAQLQQQVPPRQG